MCKEMELDINWGALRLWQFRSR